MHRVFRPACATLALALFALPTLRADEPTSKTVAHIRLHGELDETPVPADPLFGGSCRELQEQARPHPARRRRTTTVQALYLEIDGLSIGWGKLDELSRAIADFRKTRQEGLRLPRSRATPRTTCSPWPATRSAMPESGWLMLTGLRAEVTFYKDLFDKLGVKADMLQMGDFKAAAEPYTRTSMSDASRKQLDSVLDDYYEKSIVERIVKAPRRQEVHAPSRSRSSSTRAPTPRKAAAEGRPDRPRRLRRRVRGRRSRPPCKADNVKVVKNYGQAKTEDLDLSNPFALFKLLTPAEGGVVATSPRSR